MPGKSDEMSANAKTKTKTKTNETTLAEAVAIAGEATTGATPATEAAPSDGPAAEAPAAATTAEAPIAKTPLLLRARVATGKAVVTLFAKMRTAQSTAVTKSLAWITAADAGLSKSLVVGEQYVLSRLKVSPEA